MSPPNPRRPARLASFALLGLLLLGGCSSIGDFGRLQDPVVTDDIHAWVGREAAAHAAAPISLDNLTDTERALRDLGFPLIEPPYDRQRWDAVLYEYGTKREFQRELWTADASAYYRHLQGAGFRSSSGRYNRLIDDIRNDVVRIGPFFEVARRIVDLDRRREASLHYLTDLSPKQRASALARIGENSLTIAWVHQSLLQRCAGYRFALDHLAAGEPDWLAAEAERALAQLQQLVAANDVVPMPRLAAAPPSLAARAAPIDK